MILIISSSKSHCYLFKNLLTTFQSKNLSFQHIQLHNHKNLNDLIGVKSKKEYNNRIKLYWYLGHYQIIKNNIENYLSSNSFKFIILANDIGYLEKLLIKVSKKLGIKSILIEDGNVSIKSRNSISHKLLYRLFDVLIMFNLHDFASNRMGGFGCDIIIAKNEASCNYFKKIRRKSTDLYKMGFLSNFRNKEGIQNLESNPDIIYFLSGFEQSKLLTKYQEQEEKIILVLQNLCETHKKQLQLVPHPDSNITFLKRKFSFAKFLNKTEALNSNKTMYFTYSSSVIFEIVNRNKEVYCIDLKEFSHLREYIHPDNIIDSEKLLFNLYENLDFRNELYAKIHSEILGNFPPFQIENFLNLLSE